MWIYGKLFGIFTPRDRVKYVLLGMLTAALGVIESVNVASVLPFLAILADPAIIHENTYLAWAYGWSGAESDREFLVMVGIVVFGMILFTQGFRAFVIFRTVNFARMREHEISTRLMEKYLAQPYVWFTGRNSNDLSKTLLQEVGQACGHTIMPSIRIVAQCLIIILLLSLMVAVNPEVALIVSSVVGGLYLLLMWRTSSLLRRLSEQRVDSNRRRFRIAANAFSAIKEIKLAGLEHQFKSRFTAQSSLYVSSAARNQLVTDIPMYFFEALLFGGIILLILLLLARSDGNFDSIMPTLGIYALATARIFPAAQGFYRNLNLLRFGSRLLDDMAREFSKVTDLALPAPGTVGEPLRLCRHLTLEDVVYTYPGTNEPVLRGLSLRIPVNTTVGIVGGTGAGKTSMVDIILGLLAPQSGRVIVDDVVLDRTNIRRWQRSLGYVPQQITLLDESVRSNIAFGVAAADVDDAAVERAARAAEIHSFVDTLPQGYQTRVGERGGKLSGGQRQRIGIARALYHNPDMLILDEATSALDNLTERQVMEAIHALKSNKTVLMIAHRLSTVRNCDQIIFLERGQVRSIGTYDELLAQDDEFERLVHAAP